MIVERESVTAALPNIEIGRRLGAGGFGLVLAGRHRLLNRDVAVKVMPADENTRAGFMTEAQVLAGLDHPHIVRVYDYVETDELCLIVMEQLPGGTLTQRSAGNTPEWACAVTVTIASALAYAHDRGVLHRDIKPDNVLFDAAGTVKVTDFGIAKIFEGSSASGTTPVGTPMYMGPEQFLGSRIGPYTDLYSLGVVLYRLLTGRPPYGPRLLLAQIWQQKLTAPPDIPPDVPAPVAGVLRRALEKEPTSRQPSVHAFALELAAAASVTYGPGWLARAGLSSRLDDDIRDAAAGSPPASGPPVVSWPASSGTPTSTPASTPAPGAVSASASGPWPTPGAGAPTDLPASPSVPAGGQWAAAFAGPVPLADPLVGSTGPTRVTRDGPSAAGPRGPGPGVRRGRRKAAFAATAGVAALVLVAALVIVLNRPSGGHGGPAAAGAGTTHPGSASTDPGGVTPPAGPTSGVPAPKKVYTIGVQAPLTGSHQSFGANVLGGVRTAIDEANGRSDLPFTLRLATADDTGAARAAPAAARSLVGSDAIAVVGPTFSDTTEASEPVYRDAGVLSASPSATSAALTRSGYSTFYRAVPSDSLQAPAAAHYIAGTLRVTDVIAIDDGTTYGVGLANSLAEALAPDTTVARDSIAGVTDYAAKAAAVVEAAPGLAFFAGGGANFVSLVMALRSQGYSGAIMAGDGALDMAFVAKAGPSAAEGVYFTCGCLVPNAQTSDAAQSGFITSYRSANSGASPGIYSAEAYDATNAIIAALTGLGTNATRPTLAAAFAAGDVPGLTGRMRFQPGGELADQRIVVYRVREGQIVSLATST